MMVLHVFLPRVIAMIIERKKVWSEVTALDALNTSCDGVAGIFTS